MTRPGNMPSQGVIAVFVKTPGLSPVKTRLAQVVGKGKAEQFYRLAVQATSEVVQSVQQHYRLDAVYAVAEQQALQNPQWSALPVLWQGEGGLGERMAFIYQQLLQRYDFVILVGSDIPQMTPRHFRLAIDAIQQSPMVMAPSLDGGFWLFGGRCPLPESVWMQVEYSQADTAAQLCVNLKPYGKIAQLPGLQDIDEWEDLADLYKSLARLSSPTPGQQRLLLFLPTLLVTYA